MNALESLAVIGVASCFLLLANVPARESVALRGEKLEMLPAAEAARRIEDYARSELPACFADLQGEDGILTRAIVAVEYVEHSALENFMETVAVKIAARLGMSVPDLSLGPAQMRPSTVCRLLPEHEGCLNSVPHQDVALSLLSRCRNIQLAQQLVAVMLGKQRVEYAAFDPKVASAVAREYNGQQDNGLENLIYRALVTHIYVNNLARLSLEAGVASAGRQP